MLIAGVIVSIVSILLVIFPKFFLKLKSPDTAFLQMKKLHNNKKIILAVRMWGIICLIIGITLIIISFK
jgi:hypothetical protein